MTKKKNNIMAIMYDFDNTLCIGDMQNYGFIPAVGMQPQEFWHKTGEIAKKEKSEKILTFLYAMVMMSREKKIPLTREYLKNQGRDIKYFPGVLSWFDRINAYGKSKGIKVEHYLVTSGNKEIVEGCVIAPHFKQIFGSEYIYDKDTKEAIWVKNMINYTQKTQYFFRISRGVTDITNDDDVNKRVEEKNKRIPYRNFVYIGDGMTDVACMVLVKEKGGKSIAVYPEGKKEKIQYLIDEERVNLSCRADYRHNSPIDRTIRLLIDNLEIINKIKEEEEK
ncbi:MAG: haloacid dehalogenase-like hydrolase [Erysipelotrichaceae bacterium]|nr:haloacid dehalogenase-like hydrolase [Erysipelotrichaceae bacterium]